MKRRSSRSTVVRISQHPFTSSWGTRGATWEGDTLVVDTRNILAEPSFNPKGTRIQKGSAPNMHLVERFTCVDADTLLYEFTVDDPTTWTRSWTAAVPVRRGLPAQSLSTPVTRATMAWFGMLSGARAEKAASRQHKWGPRCGPRAGCCSRTARAGPWPDPMPRRPARFLDREDPWSLLQVLVGGQGTSSPSGCPGRNGVS